MPSTIRASFSFGFSVTFVTVNFGESPSIFRSARFVSPSCLNASLRIASMRSVRFVSLAVVKSHARTRPSRSMPASVSVLKRLSMCARRSSTALLVVSVRSR